jgi:antirestriction protein ArdC
MTSYEVITEQIIAKMNEGVIPWVKPWHSNAWSTDGMNKMFPAYSYSNGKRYNFMNQMLLGFEAGEFATFEQIKKAGGKVKKGEKSTIVAGWIVEDKPITDKDGNILTDEDGNEETKTTFALRYYRVFNILTQCEGMTPKHNWTKDEAPESDLQPEEAAEAIIENYITSKDAPKFTVLKGSDKAYYSPAFDEVVIPHMSQFEAIAEYYSTAFHELTHSTSKESRCNRKTTGKKAAFGSKEYSKEELVAEIGSCFLNSQAGLTTESSFRNSTAYLQNWMTALKNDPKMIIQASAQAEKAAEYILNA